jgi:hypothetical protein
MSNSILRTPGQTVVLSLSLIDNVTPANNPVTGETCVVSIRRLSDDRWFNFTTWDWDAVAFSSLTSANRQDLADKGDGSYQVEWDQATADAGATRTYCMYYRAVGGAFASMVTQEEWDFSAEWVGAILTAENPGGDIGTVGQQLVSAGVAGDPWTAEYPGDYGVDTMGGHINSLAAQGSGVFSVVIPLRDQNGTAVPGVLVQVRNTQDAEPPAAVGGTDADGNAKFNLDAGTYHVWLGPAPFYRFSNSYTVFVTASGTLTPLVATLLVTPVASAPDMCSCYDDLRWLVGGDVVGAGVGKMKLVRVISPAFPDADAGAASLVAVGAEEFTDASGRVSMDLVRGAVVEVLLECGASSYRARFTVPDAASAYIPTLLAEAAEEA